MALNLKLLRLIDGSEILGEVTETDTHATVKNPVRVMIVPSKTDPKTPTVGFAPWADFSDDKEFTIHKAHIVVIMNPVTEFVNQYNSMFGGIIQPKSKIITDL